ncbi:uncharacterized protein TRAVEDRAFT_47362 [Trametes versicolor FP-101664 SS1]|uniref:uncharacterized protein n=1 Tax=Trametes versicolor (strain FP-101664) TaxID=717944 RepID=UPI0004623DC3|nr:uncharacterized protein TRAVEDRAFT_47362 [Trametes versicolor FP-101664 SS1]EIW58193.1 hypothetical protein TRAVEDRAFT_47362 [Trametes versicolor FP-101664 SS1]
MPERIYPIPKPRCLPEAIYATASQASSTLQEQMRFEGDVDTFSTLISIIRQTTARHTDLALSYRQQDPEVLEKIKHEILTQCPTLEVMYPNGWPITSYLQVALKKHKPIHSDRNSSNSLRVKRSSRRMYSHPSERKRAVPENELYSDYGLAAPTKAMQSGNPAQMSSIGADSRPRRLLRRSARLKKLKGNEVIEIVDTSEHEESENGNEDDESSSGSEKQGKFEYEADEAGSESDVKADEIVYYGRVGSFTPDSPSNSRASPQVRARKFEGAPRTPVASDASPPPTSSLRRVSSLLSEPPDTRATQSPRATSNDPIETRQRSFVAPAESLPPIVVHTDPGPSNAVQNAAVQDLLRARGLPHADVERIALLFASLGIADDTYLRIFACLPSRYREMWLSELREKGLLSEIQTWVILDMLDVLTAG